jgi:hypothetical protein
MKARFAITATPVASWFRHSTIRLAVLLSMVLIASILAATLYRARPSAPLTTPAAAGVPAALDQHERHPNLFTAQAEHAALDQHERHPNGLPADIYAPLDQQDRHPDLFGPKAEHAALPDALDRYLASRSRP